MSEPPAVHRPRKIVVGVDGSEHARTGLEWSIAMASGMGSEVVAVYGLEVPTYWYAGQAGYGAGTLLPPQFDDQWKADVRHEFEEVWCAPLKAAGVRYRTVMREGAAAAVLTEVADAEAADLVVVGRRGRGGIAELVLGSVSHAVVLHAKRPVLVVSGPGPG